MNKFKNKTQEELEGIVCEINDTIKKYTFGIVLVGSLAYGKNYSIKESTDIDLLILADSEKIPYIFNTKIYENYKLKNVKTSLELFKNNKIDIISTRQLYKNKNVTIHFLKPKNFLEKFSNLKNPFTLYSIRQKPKKYIYEFKSFKGESLYVPVKNFKTTYGYKTEMKTFIIKDKHYYSGSPHNKLLGNPIILTDTDNIIDYQTKYFFEMSIERLIMEYGKKINQKSISIVNTLVRKERFNPYILENILNKEKKYLLKR